MPVAATVRTRNAGLKKKDLAWQSVRGNGSVDDTPRYTQLSINPVSGVSKIVGNGHLVVTP